jgi:hypothetical protein
MTRRALPIRVGIVATGVVVMGWFAGTHDAAKFLRGIITIDRPENGRIADGRYTNHYFGLSYRLPPGWTRRRRAPTLRSRHTTC